MLRSVLSVVVALGCGLAISGCAVHYRSAYEQPPQRTVYRVKEVKVVKVKYKKKDQRGHAYGHDRDWGDD